MNKGLLLLLISVDLLLCMENKQQSTFFQGLTPEQEVQMAADMNNFEFIAFLQESDRFYRERQRDRQNEDFFVQTDYSNAMKGLLKISKSAKSKKSGK